MGNTCRQRHSRPYLTLPIPAHRSRPDAEHRCSGLRSQGLQADCWQLSSRGVQMCEDSALFVPQSRRDRSRRAAGDPDVRQHEAWDSEDEAAFRADWHMSRAEEVGAVSCDLGFRAFRAVWQGGGGRGPPACSETGTGAEWTG